MPTGTFRCYCCDKELTAEQALADAQHLTDRTFLIEDEETRMRLSEIGVHMTGPNENFADFKAEYKQYPMVDGLEVKELYPIDIRPYKSTTVGEHLVEDGWEHGWGVFCRECIDKTEKGEM